MTDPTAEMQVKLKVLIASYAEKLPEKIQEIEDVWEKLSTEKWDHEDARNLHRRVHSLTGSGKSFGFALLSDLARNLEVYLKNLVQSGKVPDDEQRNQVRVLLTELRQASTKNGFDQPAGVSFASSQKKKATSLVAEDEATSSLYWCPVRRNRIFVVEDDPALAASLKAQLSYFGYEVDVYGTLAHFRVAMADKPDVIVLMDVTSSEFKTEGIETIKQIQKGRSAPIPVIFISANNEFDARLEAARAGGIAFMSKPLNIVSLIDKLDTLTSPIPPVPYRILIVDDSVALAAFYAAVLEQAGMVVTVVNDPLEVMPPLLEFIPDLILIDLYMPGCNGMELAKVIRQFDALVSIPIVFLSAEKNLENQLLALGLGADDFLTKPIEPDHLISSVSSRVRRSLKLRSFMVRDSLTGLLNHTAIMDQLAREVARTRRQGTDFSFAMVDIDYFKKINDTYGHPVGDRVIKSLSRLLKQRLRENDAVGRYGGEEFAVILSDTDGTTAVNVLDIIRQDFSQLRHLADGKEFSVSFSCGVADGRNFAASSALSEAADRALYQAKHAGRNRVVLAGQHEGT